MSLNDPKSTAHTLLKLMNSNIPAARINTPIAAVASNALEEIRVFYITVDSHMQEICHFKRHGWQKGTTIGTAEKFLLDLFSGTANSPCMRYA
ncbi:hypothetical protein C8R48DRAFT_780986 [Suillus tomentosus]|nr:hypothetical protein C8R48DRAFT_780986 [Suillus tomentosus]